MNVLFRWTRLPLSVLAVLCFTACGEDHGARESATTDSMARIEGSVIYRERIMLPPGVDVEVQLEDVSSPDAMATVLATVLLQPEGGPPYAFAIEYDPAAIDPRSTYAIRASISHGGRMMFTTTDYINPFQGNPLEVLVRRVPATMLPQEPVLEGGSWALHTLAGEPAPAGAEGKPVDMVFAVGELSVSGFSGCNRYSGGYALDGVAEHGSPVKFGPLAGTMMSCEDAAELEGSYLQALGRVTAFRLDGDTLSLLAGPEVLATFKPL